MEGRLHLIVRNQTPRCVQAAIKLLIIPSILWCIVQLYIGLINLISIEYSLRGMDIVFDGFAI